jgi:hypothetical protein
MSDEDQLSDASNNQAEPQHDVNADGPAQVPFDQQAPHQPFSGSEKEPQTQNKPSSSDASDFTGRTPQPGGFSYANEQQRHNQQSRGQDFPSSNSNMNQPFPMQNQGFSADPNQQGDQGNQGFPTQGVQGNPPYNQAFPPAGMNPSHGNQGPQWAPAPGNGPQGGGPQFANPGPNAQQFGMPMQPAKKKGLPTGAIIGVVVAVVAVIALILAVVFSGMGGLKSNDYLDGTNQVNTMNKRYYRISQEMSDILNSAYGDSGTMDEQDTTKIKQRIKEFEESNKDFADLKIMSDDNVKKSYETYSKKAKTYAKYTTNIADSAVALVDASKSCGDEPTASAYDSDFYTDYESYISACQTDLDALSKVPDQSIADYGSALGDYITKLGDLISQMKALGNIDDIEYGTDAYNKIMDLQDDFYDLGGTYDIVDDFQKNLKDEEDNTDPSDELKDLGNVVQDGFDELISK